MQTGETQKTLGCTTGEKSAGVGPESGQGQGPGPMGPKGGPMGAKERAQRKGTIFIDGCPSMSSLMEIH